MFRQCLQNAEVMKREVRARQEASVRGLLALLTSKPNLSTQQRAAAVHPLMGSLPLPVRLTSRLAFSAPALHQLCSFRPCSSHAFDLPSCSLVSCAQSVLLLS